MGKHITNETKTIIIADIKQHGLKVAEAAIKYQVSTKAIYRWLGESTDGSGTSILEVARLRRENQQLKEIIGMFVLDSEKSKKNR